MIKERYVSLAVAMLLRDKGFNEECTKLYDINFDIVEIKYYSCIETVYNEALKYILTNLV